MRFYFLCPAGLATGGTELIHQVCQCLGQMRLECYIVYPDMDGIHCPTPDTFLKYNVKYVSRYIDAADSVLVMAETQVHLIDECKKGIPVIWWLSVNNYYKSYANRLSEENIDIFELKARPEVIHFVQSHYAADFLVNGLGIDRYYFLKDYINDDIFKIADECKTYAKDNICLYNPKKGYESLKNVINNCRKDIKWVPLVGMTPEQVAETMCGSKVYIDFGEHPGKDRIPREATLCGCCIITNTLGSAAYKGDVNIPDKYKITDMDDTQKTLDIIYELIDNYEEHCAEYDLYRREIVGEKAEFINDLYNVVNIIKDKVTLNLSKEGDRQPLHDAVFEDMRRVLKLMDECLIKAIEQNQNIHNGDTINELLNLDYLLQITREITYASIIELSK